MRNRRLLTLAVLAVALGFAAYAQAETAIVTVVESGTAFEVRYSISGGASVGSTATTPGALDFAIKGIYGLSGGSVDTLAIDAPESAVGVGGVPAGFNATTGIRATTKDDANGIWTVVLLQPAAYDDPCAPAGPTVEQDAAVLMGIGTKASTDPSVTLPYNGVDWTAAGPTYDADIKMLSGTLTAGSGSRTVELETFGVDSFSVLPSSGSYVDSNGRYTGVLYNNLYTECPAVEAVVMQYSSAANGGGTVAPTVATTLKVVAGDVQLGSSYASSSFVTLQVSEPNTSITLTANKTVGGLDIQTGGAGYQVVDVGAARLDVVGGDVGLIKAMKGDGTDGLYSSQVDLANEVLVVTGTGGAVAVKATIYGDIDLDGDTDIDDYNIFLPNWQKAVAGDWTDGDLDADGDVDIDDYNLFLPNWQKAFTPTGAGVPEPATMALLALGGLAVLRRRRRS